MRAITNGFFDPALRETMDELTAENQLPENKLSVLSAECEKLEISESDMRLLFSQLNEFICSNNLAECKKYINAFIKQVTVFTDHIEIAYHLPNPLVGTSCGFTVNASCSKSNLKKIS